MAKRESRIPGPATAVAAALAISVGCAGTGGGLGAIGEDLGGPPGGAPGGGSGGGFDGVAGARRPGTVGPLRGRVVFDALAYATQATIGEDVAPASPVSLIDPSSGFTLASALTDSGGGFLLTFSEDFAPKDQAYILEASKGLKDSTGPNAPGASIARVRTFVRPAGGAWKGLNRGELTISTATTALTAAAGLKGLKDTVSVKPVSALFDTLEQGTADGTVLVDGVTVDVNSRFNPTADLSVAEYKRLYGLVARALADDADPIASVYRDAAGATPDTQFLRSAAPTAVLGFAEAKASRGQTATLVGRNLSADAEVWFAAYQGSVDSNLTRVPVAATIGALSADRRTLEVTVPSNAASGEVVYRRGFETFRVSTLYGIVGTVVTVVGTGRTGFNGDGLPGDRTNLKGPKFLTFDPAGNLVVSDVADFRIRKWDRITGAVTTLAGSGANGYSGDGGPARAAQFRSPTGVAFDRGGNLYIADGSSNVLRRVDDRSGIISTFAGTGAAGYSGDGGPATAATFSNPDGLTVDPAGNVYVGDYYNTCVRRIDATTGIVTTVPGSSGLRPSGIHLGPDGALYYAANMVRRLDLQGGPATTWASPPGAGEGIWVDSGGNVFVGGQDPDNRIRRVDAGSRAVTVVAGSGSTAQSFSGDGGDPLQAAFLRPGGVAVDGAGNLFIADYSNSRIRYVALP